MKPAALVPSSCWLLLLASLFVDEVMSNAITNFRLVTKNGTDLGLLNNGDVLLLRNMPVNWTIIATSSGTVGSVRFNLNGNATYSWLENAKPWSLKGDRGPTDYEPWSTPAERPLGNYSLIATPYRRRHASGTVGTARQVTFSVRDTTPATDAPTASPTALILSDAPNGVFPLGRCMGECFHDNDCEIQLHCFHRSGNEAVPSCSGDGVPGRGYCARILDTPGDIRYKPGDFNVYQNGLVLSQGLLSRVIARSGEPVPFYSPAMGLSSSTISFHNFPDGAAVFTRPETTGWVYVSNSEDELDGGVGAIYFDSQGHVKDYKKILSGTMRNCGGGKTFWNTFLTGEEHNDGLIHEVDPWGDFSHVTVVGKRAMNYESVAYDNRNVSKPTFYATVDEFDGPLLRFTPDPQQVSDTLASGNWQNFLKSPARPGAKWEYLVLSYTGSKTGTYSWTTNINQGWASAFTHFKHVEGIDIRDGRLYMTAKWDQLLFILDLDQRTFVESSTRSGAFEDQPDQVARLVGDDPEGILYFCEDAESGSGVHGRNATGSYFTILQADNNTATNGGVNMMGETTGLAFSPDNMFMYVSYQAMGKVVEVRRSDGLPFNGMRLDIKYHSV